MLDLVRNSINHVPEAAALFYDELANVIEKRQLDPKTEVNGVMIGGCEGGLMVMVMVVVKGEGRYQPILTRFVSGWL